MLGIRTDRPASAIRDLDWQRLVSDSLPFVALIGMFIWCVDLQPSSLSIDGISLLFSSAIPLVFATMSQMFIITLGDIDLGTGYFIGLVNAIAARYLADRPLLAVGLLLLTVVGYLIAGALVQLRRIPAIIVTLGASFIWLGFALITLPIPGGTAPAWLVNLFNWNPPVIPVPLLYSAIIAAAAYLIMFQTSLGTVLRGAGSNPQAVTRGGWSMLRIRMTAYGLAAVFGVLAGLALTGITSSGDPNASANFTLLSIAAVILGGGDFAGGKAAPIGGVVGALAISLVTSLLALLNVASDFQAGVQGLILIIVLAGRAFTRRLET